jgi:O-antigen/teichoic acid export membrane protein
MTTTSTARSSGVSTTKAISFVYVAYAFRYLYLVILVPFYGRVLGAAEYGRLLAAMALFQLVWMLAEFGFPSVGIRDIALERTPKRSAEVYGQHISGRVLTMAVGIVTGVIGTLISPLLRERPIFGVLATLMGITSAFNLGWYFQGHLRFRTSVTIELIGFTLNIVFVLLLVHGKEDGWIVLASLLGSSLVATVVSHSLALRSMDRSSLRWTGGVSLVRESTALFAARGLALLTASSSTFLMSVFAGAKQVGWYGAADRLATAGLSLMLPASQVMVGTIASLIASKETEDAAFALVRRGLLLLMALGVGMSAATLALSGIAVPLILGTEFRPSIRVLRILGVMFPFAAFGQVASFVLIPLRYDRVVSAVNFVGAVVTVGLTVGLGRVYGGDGVASARTLGYVAMSWALLYVLRREGLIERIMGRGWRMSARWLPDERTDARK